VSLLVYARGATAFRPTRYARTAIHPAGQGDGLPRRRSL